MSSATVRTLVPDVPATGPLTYRWERSIEVIGKQAWERCFGTESVYDAFELALAVERARLEGFELHYLFGECGGQIAFILPCFKYRISLALLAPRMVQRFVEGIRRLFPGALYFTMFVAGSPVAICKDSVGMQQIPEAERAAALREAKRLILNRARELRSSFAAFKEITEAKLPLLKAALEPEFHVVESLPTMYLPIQGPGTPTYVDRLRKKQRNLLRKRRRMFAEAGLRWETTSDFARYAEAFIPLYLQVLERATTKVETLTSEFFREISRGMGDRAFALLGFKGDTLVAFELFLHDGQWLHPMYLGFDYAYRDSAALYFNCIYQIIDECERRGYPVVQLGQSAYEVKGLMGAVMARLYLGVHHSNPLVHSLIGKLSPLLFPRLPVPRHDPLKDPEMSAVILALRSVRYEP